MKRHRQMVMSRAFDTAFDMLKMDHFVATYGAALFDSLLAKAQDDSVLRKQLEEYLNMSMGELADLPPDEKEYAFKLIQEHRAQQPKSVADPQGEAPMPTEDQTPMQKAFDVVVSNFLKMQQ